MNEALFWTPFDRPQVTFVSGNGTVRASTGLPPFGRKSGIVHLALERDWLVSFPSPASARPLTTGRIVSVAYWFVILVVFSLWFIFLLTRWRRMRIKSKTNIPLTP
ncbi:hypothetical protein WKV53_13365 [Luteolibacter sp. Y139]|uniref:Uncharacterized protein n=1 Tax=Luteolibacter soli TaxID=3135280 RepID=A0ABU9AVT5_9BACT